MLESPDHKPTANFFPSAQVDSCSNLKICLSRRHVAVEMRFFIIDCHFLSASSPGNFQYAPPPRRARPILFLNLNIYESLSLSPPCSFLIHSAFARYAHSLFLAVRSVRHSLPSGECCSDLCKGPAHNQGPISGGSASNIVHTNSTA